MSDRGVAEIAFYGTELAERIERAETQLISAGTEAARRRNPGAAAFVRPVAGGAACFAEDGSPFNKVVGLGFGGVPGDAELDEIERAYAGFVAPTQVELANLADPGIGLLLTGRGYRLVAFENVLGRSLEMAETRPASAELDIRLSTEDELDAWVEVVTTGFALLAARLSDAAKAGCDIAVVTTAPGSKSQQNAQRQGFALLYTRAVLVKDTE